MAKKEISFKQIGQNVIIVVDGQQYSKKMTEKSDRESLKEKIVSYNKKNTVTLQKEIVLVFTQKNAEVKEKSKKVAKVVEKVKTASKILKNKKEKINKELTLADLEKLDSLTDAQVEHLSNLLAKNKKTEIPKENKKTTRRGEY